MNRMSKYFLAHVPNAIATKYNLHWQRSPQASQVIMGDVVSSCFSCFHSISIAIRDAYTCAGSYTTSRKVGASPNNARKTTTRTNYLIFKKKNPTKQICQEFVVVFFFFNSYLCTLIS